MYPSSFGTGGVCWTDASISLRNKDRKPSLCGGKGVKTRKWELLGKLSVSVFHCASQGLLCARHNASW